MEKVKKRPRRSIIQFLSKAQTNQDQVLRLRKIKLPRKQVIRKGRTNLSSRMTSRQRKRKRISLPRL